MPTIPDDIENRVVVGPEVRKKNISDDFSFNSKFLAQRVDSERRQFFFLIKQFFLFSTVIIIVVIVTITVASQHW
jgi:hypothetical protein